MLKGGNLNQFEFYRQRTEILDENQHVIAN